MSDVVNLEEKIWNKSTEPNLHKPIAALKAIVRDIETGKFNPSHVIIVYKDNARVGYYQAGEADGYLGTLGLLTRAIQIVSE